MKERIKGTLLLFCFSVVITSAVVLTQRTVAKGKDSEHITFSEPILVAGTLLKGDTYKVVWDGSGPQLQVSFIKGSKTVVTAPATLVLEKNANDGSVETKTLEDNSRVLVRRSPGRTSPWYSVSRASATQIQASACLIGPRARFSHYRRDAAGALTIKRKTHQA